MAALLGGTTGAMLTATIMIFEMTRDYTIILPVILTVVLANAVRQWLLPTTIYTLKLQRRGHVVSQGLQGWDGERRSSHVMSAEFRTISQSEARNEKLVRKTLARGKVLIVIGPDHDVRGVIGPWRGLDATTESAKDFVTVHAEDRMSEVLRALQPSGVRVALVRQDSDSTGGPVLGVIGEREVTQLACAAARFTG
jgi:CIC family chloride channel protein